MDKSSGETRTYQARQRVGWGLAIWREMWRELVDSRELIVRLFIRDFSARYKQSIFGVLWALILPLAMVATFVFLKGSGVLAVGEMSLPYPAYALLGLTIWQIFGGGLGGSAAAITAGGSMVSKINFPRETLVIVAFGHVLFDTLIRLILVVIVFAAYKIVPAWTVLFFPLSLVPLLLLALGIGFMLALLNALFRDIAYMVTLATTFLLFITPVLYKAPANGGLFAQISQYNPLAALITGSRDLVIMGNMTDSSGYIWASIFSIVLFFVAWRIFHLAELRIAERVGGR